MSTHLSSRYTRLAMLAMILALLAFSLAKPVSAAYPSISISAVKVDDTVTIRTHDFPSYTNFTIRMDVTGNLAINGIVAGYMNSGLGGDIEATYRIPAELRGVQTIAIRFDSDEGYYAYNWFANHTAGTPADPGNGTIPVTGSKPSLTFLGVKANDSVTVEAYNLPAYTTLMVRVGPYLTFFRDYVIMPSVRTDGSGYARFTIDLPDVVMDVERVTVRLDGGGHYAYNAFKNVDSGTVIPVTSTGTCQVVSVTPSSYILAGYEFDAVWTIKNTSSKTWDGNSVDYKYVSGSKMHKYDSRYDLHQNIDPGETVKVIVDMKAPSTAGYYSTNWALVQGSTTLCNLPLNLRVK